MRKFFVTTFVLAAMLCLATSGMALEKRATSFDGDGSDDWNAGGTTCRVNYYNTCTGWVWCWSGFGDGGRLGLVVDSCCDNSAALLQSAHFACTPAPSGYGFTGTVAVHNVDANDCPVGAAIASQPFLPAIGPGLNTVAWPAVPVPSQFVLVVTMRDGIGGVANPASMGTDHPAAGPTGPAACGTCYPSTRPNHSFAYGTAGTPVCPGSTFNDGICDAQLFWDVDLACTVSVDESSWGSIKGLYR